MKLLVFVLLLFKFLLTFGYILQYGSSLIDPDRLIDVIATGSIGFRESTAIPSHITTVSIQ